MHTRFDHGLKTSQVALVALLVQRTERRALFGSHELSVCRNQLLTGLENARKHGKYTVIRRVLFGQPTHAALGTVQLIASDIDKSELKRDARLALGRAVAVLLDLLEQPDGPLEVATVFANQLGQQQVSLGSPSLAPQGVVEQLAGFGAHGLALGTTGGASLVGQQVGQAGHLNGVVRGQAHGFTQQLLGFFERLGALGTLGHAQDSVCVGQHRSLVHRGLEQLDGLVATTFFEQQCSQSGLETGLVGQRLDALLEHANGLLALATGQPESGSIVEQLGHRSGLKGGCVVLDKLFGLGVVAAHQLGLEQPEVRVAGDLVQHFADLLCGQAEVWLLASQQSEHRVAVAIKAGERRADAVAPLAAGDGLAVRFVHQCHTLDPFGIASGFAIEVGQAAVHVEVTDFAERQAAAHQRVHCIGAAVSRGNHVQQSVGQKLNAALAADAQLGDLAAERRGAQVSQQGQRVASVALYAVHFFANGLAQLVGVGRALHLHVLGVIGQFGPTAPSSYGVGADSQRISVNLVVHRPELLAGELGNAQSLEDLVQEAAHDAAKLHAAQARSSALGEEDRLNAAGEDQTQRVGRCQQRFDQHLESALAEEASVATRGPLQIVHDHGHALGRGGGLQGLDCRGDGLAGLVGLSQQRTQLWSAVLFADCGDVSQKGVVLATPTQRQLGQALEAGVCDGRLDQPALSNARWATDHDGPAGAKDFLERSQLVFASDHLQVWSLGSGLLFVLLGKGNLGQVAGRRRHREIAEEHIGAALEVRDGDALERTAERERIELAGHHQDGREVRARLECATELLQSNGIGAVGLDQHDDSAGLRQGTGHRAIGDLLHRRHRRTGQRHGGKAVSPGDFEHYGAVTQKVTANTDYTFARFDG